MKRNGSCGKREGTIASGNRMQEARVRTGHGNGRRTLSQSPNTAVREMGRRTCGSHCVPRSRVDRGRADRSRGSTSRISRSRGGERRGAAASHDRARVRRCRSAKRRGFPPRAKSDSGRLAVKPCSARTRTWVASGFGPTISRTVDTGNAPPRGIELGPLRHTVDVGDDLCSWERPKFLETPPSRGRHQATDGKVPCRGVHFRHHTGVKHRKPIGGVLTGWKPRRIDALGGGSERLRSKNEDTRRCYRRVDRAAR